MMKTGIDSTSIDQDDQCRVHEVKLETDPDEPNETRNDVALTWEDVWVMVPDKSKGVKPILQGVTGYARPGELLAIMGPSGCGKSTLLDALAGRLSSNMRQTGDILVNGHKQALAYGTSAYVMQDDILIATLTVREAVYYTAQLQLPDYMPVSEKRERAETAIREMGLQEAMDTRIGGWGTKGLSGGQKRRVSICLEIVTRPKLLFLDEPPSGLDSAASYYVMSRIASLGQRDGIRRTIITSIHQPSSEVFQLFHNLCLLSSGRTVYFGPASAATDFFASNGFPCPTLQNPSDHFLKTINKDFDVDIEQGAPGKFSREDVINTLVKSYRSSPNCHEVLGEVAKINKQARNSGHGAPMKEGTHAKFVTRCLVLTRRSSLNMYRDRGYYQLRLAIYVIVALGLGTTYCNVGSTYGSIQARGSLLVFIASFLTFMAIGGFPSFVEDMKVFARERLNGHYGAGAFVIGNMLSSTPYLLLISLIPGAIAYYLPGLQRGWEHFLYFAVVLFTCMMLVESLMMTVASIVPNFLMGIITGAGIQALMVLGGGFFRLPNDLPVPIWKYPVYYIAFHRYAYEGLFKNEFKGLKFPRQAGTKTFFISGEQVLTELWQMDMGYSKWLDLVVLIGMVILYRVMFLAIVKGSEVVKPALVARISVTPKQTKQVIVNPSDNTILGDD
ncbi:hypothetical protein BT93_A2222 [Corymbia citriodora subsp. variegata]|nr:hypothetical protein BT93_A2222 [Corymbia citriodora subsp. variegata]